MPARLVVRLPPDLSSDDALAFARDVRSRGADLLAISDEPRAGGPLDLPALRRELPFLALETERPLSEPFVTHARACVVSPSSGRARSADAILTHAFAAPVSTAEAAAWWQSRGVPKSARVIHVEPLGELASAGRLLETQRALGQLFSEVTVLVEGACAVPFRCVLGERNALDVVSSEPGRNARGERFLDDAGRQKDASVRHARLGLLGTDLADARAPSWHRQPFDRLDLPADAEIGPLLELLHAHYAGLVIAPGLGAAVAQHLGVRGAVGLIRRTPTGWEAFDTAPAGAAAVLDRLDAREVIALGASPALATAAQAKEISLTVIDRPTSPIAGACIWCWPPDRAPEVAFVPGTEVVVISGGSEAKQIAARIRSHGGTPRLLGAAWAIAVTRRERELFEEPS